MLQPYPHTFDRETAMLTAIRDGADAGRGQQAAYALGKGLWLALNTPTRLRGGTIYHDSDGSSFTDYRVYGPGTPDEVIEADFREPRDFRRSAFDCTGSWRIDPVEITRGRTRVLAKQHGACDV